MGPSERAKASTRGHALCVAPSAGAAGWRPASRLHLAQALLIAMTDDAVMRHGAHTS